MSVSIEVAESETDNLIFMLVSMVHVLILRILSAGCAIMSAHVVYEYSARLLRTLAVFLR